jgi:hypothetical protein
MTFSKDGRTIHWIDASGTLTRTVQVHKGMAAEQARLQEEAERLRGVEVEAEGILAEAHAATAAAVGNMEHTAQHPADGSTSSGGAGDWLIPGLLGGLSCAVVLGGVFLLFRSRVSSKSLTDQASVTQCAVATTPSAATPSALARNFHRESRARPCAVPDDSVAATPSSRSRDNGAQHMQAALPGSARA